MSNPTPNPGFGRPFGSRNKRTLDVIKKLRTNGFKDPLLVLGELSSHSEDEHIRATASNMLAPYLHSKMGLTPARIYLEHEVHLPHPSPSKLEEIRANITYLTNLKLSAKIDTASAGSLILDQRHLHDSIFEEMKLLYSQDVTPEVSIHITGGLTSLPGTDIIMPQINGVIDAVVADPPPQPEDVVPESPVADAAAPDPAPANDSVSTDSVANPASTPDANADANATDATSSISPVVRPNAPAAPPCAPGVCYAPAATVGAMRGIVAGNGQTAPGPAQPPGPAQAAVGAADGQPPPPPPQPPSLKSQVPQRASDIKPEHRDRYPHERQLRFPSTPGLVGRAPVDRVCLALLPRCNSAAKPHSRRCPTAARDQAQNAKSL
jgi:hypothetical protein